MKIIQEWLSNGCVYNEGLSIYASLHKHNKNLLRLLRRKESETNTQKLKYELSKFASQPQTPITVSLKKLKTVLTTSDIVAANIVLKEKKQALYFHHLPIELQPILLEANILFKQLCYLKVKLNAMPKDAVNECNTIQIDIETKRHKNAQCWQKIDYWKEHKQLPAAPKNDFEDLTPAQLLRKEQNMFCAISRLNGRINEKRTKLITEKNLNTINKLKRAIAKAEANVLSKKDDLLKLKDLINGK